MPEPLSNERLAEIRTQVGRSGDYIHDALLDEVDRLRGELDRLQKVLLAEWEKDRETYQRLMTAIGGHP